MGMKEYRLDDPADLEKFNKRMKEVGLIVQESMFGGCVAYLDDARLTTVLTRRAGRHTVITPQVRMSVLQYRSEGLTIAETARKAHVSKGVVGQILAETDSREICLDGQLMLDL